MKLTRTKPNWFFLMIVTAYITSLEASDNEDLRVLIVGFRGHTRFRAANILLGRTDSSQEERETVRSEVITDEGRRMMVVTGPNLCERDTERQALKRALILSSPGPHAILMTLNLQDEEDEECDFTKQIQELLRTDVLQYCVVVLSHNDPEKNNITRALRGKVGEMINTCRERFHIFTDSHPKPAQTALIGKIDKLVWINEGRFYSTLNEITEQLKTERLELLIRLQEIERTLEKNEDNLFFPIKNKAFEGGIGLVGWSLLISLIAIVTVTEKSRDILMFEAGLAVLVMFMVSLRNALDSDRAFLLNMPLCSSLASTFTKNLPMPKKKNQMSNERHIEDITEDMNKTGRIFIVGLGVTLGTVASVRTWSDVLTACYVAPGITAGVYLVTFKFKQMNNRGTSVFAQKLFLFCIVGALLSVGCATVFTLFGVKISILLLITVISVACIMYQQTLENIKQSIFALFCSLFFVFTGSIIVILEIILSFLMLFLEKMVSSYWLNVILLLCYLGYLMTRLAYKLQITHQ